MSLGIRFIYFCLLLLIGIKGITQPDILLIGEDTYTLKVDDVNVLDSINYHYSVYDGLVDTVTHSIRFKHHNSAINISRRDCLTSTSKDILTSLGLLINLYRFHNSKEIHLDLFFKNFVGFVFGGKLQIHSSNLYQENFEIEFLEVEICGKIIDLSTNNITIDESFTDMNETKITIESNGNKVVAVVKTSSLW